MKQNLSKFLVMNAPPLSNFAILISFVLLTACDQSKAPDNEPKTDSSLFVNNPVEETPDSNAKAAVEGILASLENNDIQTIESPSGLVLGEYYASEDIEYTFCSDGRVKYDYSPDEYQIGTWEMKGDSILLHYTLTEGRKGVGKPLPEPEGMPGNYVDQYEKYEDFETKIDEKATLSWQKIKDYIKRDPEQPYKILAKNVDCLQLRRTRGGR